MASKGARATAGKVSKKGAGPQAKAAPPAEAKPTAKNAAKAAPAKAAAPAPKIVPKAKPGAAKKDATPPPKVAKPQKASPPKGAVAKAAKTVASKAAKVVKAAAAKAAKMVKAPPAKAAAPKAEKAPPKAEKAPKAKPKKAEAPKPEPAKAAAKAKKAPKAKAEAASNGHASRLEIGDSVPDVELVDHDGNAFSLGSLAGQSYVLYFYPKDDTPGCTREACAFRDDMGKFEGANVRVLGISPDKPESHVRFRDKYGMPFTLLSDAEKAAANAFGVWVKKQNYGREYMGIERSTFLIDEAGKVKKVWRNVKVDGHSQAVLDATS